MRITTPREKYIESVFGIPDPELQRVREELDKLEISFMAISSSEGRMLQFLMRAFGVKTVVEVGTLFGYSGLCMAKALPSDGKLFTVEKNPENHAVAAKMFAKSACASKIEAFCGDALQVLEQLAPRGPFDMCFIDANKAGYIDYLNWAERNVRKGGLIVGDNTFLFGGVYGPTEDREASPATVAGMKEFNQRLADPSRYNSVLIPTNQGMTVAQKL